MQQLKLYIVEVINPCQAGFVLGRRTSDNIILVQEVIQTLKPKRGRAGYVALKLDLEKAYDRLEWSFIQESLEFFQLPPNLITLIINMISSTRFHILRNRTPLPEVVPSQGVIQCDLLSLYLFILCLEWLSIKVFFFDEKLINFIHKLGQISIDNTSYIRWPVIKRESPPPKLHFLKLIWLL